jgi:hypothetical protein
MRSRASPTVLFIFQFPAMKGSLAMIHSSLNSYIFEVNNILNF